MENSGRESNYKKNTTNVMGGYLINRYPYPYQLDGVNKKVIRYNEIVNSIIDELSTMVKINNAPESFNQRKWKERLFTRGFCGIGYFNDELISVNGSIYGAPDGSLDVYEEPKKFMVENVVVGFQDRTIGNDIVLSRCDDACMGFLRKLNFLITALIESEITLINTVKNIRVMQGLQANDEDSAEAIERYLEDIENGKIGFIATNQFISTPINNLNSGVSYANDSLRQCIEAIQYIKGQIRHEMGLQSNFNMKREALNTSETLMNEQALRPYVDNVIENMKKTMEECNELFGTNMTVEFSGAWAMRDEMAQSIKEYEKETYETDENNEEVDEHEETIQA